MSIIRNSALLLSAAACAAAPALAAFTYPGCAELTAAEMKVVPLATRTAHGVAEPMKMAFDLVAAPGEDAKGKVDVYFTERMGKFRKYDSKAGTVITLGSIPLGTVNQANSSDGLLGVALDPAFKSNHRVFLYYSSITTAEKSWRVSRFTLNAAHDQVDLASEKIVIKIPIRGGSKHPGGAIQFDAYGDLWISTGNDYYNGDYPVWSSANTFDLRGKILRIHPKEDGGYSIPDGNLFKPGTDKTKPEIYVMGNRNPYTLTLDPVRRWLMWGDVGPDKTTMDGAPMNQAGSAEKTEEYDLAKAPGNYGYPFFAGTFQTKSGIDAAAPVIPADTKWDGNTPGLMTLPAAIPAIYAYGKSCAVTGPLYRYDGDLNSSIKLPPHFQRLWMVSDFNGDNQKIKVLRVSEDGTKLNGEEPIPGVALKNPLDIQQGPDGAIYVNNYGGVWRNSEANTGIVRIEYSGSCRPATPKLEKPEGTGIAFRASSGRQGPKVEFLRGSALAVSVATLGDYTAEISDLQGRALAALAGSGRKPLVLGAFGPSGLYFLRVRAAEGESLVRFARD